MLNFCKKVVVVAPHPDDETLGVGGTIAKLCDLNVEVSILILGGHLPPVYDEKHFLKTQKEAVSAFKVLGVKKWHFVKIPATKFCDESVVGFNNYISTFIDKMQPDTVFIPFPDRHIDHRISFEASMVACRPVGNHFPKLVLAYETLSETYWNAGGIEATFIPDFFVDISNHIDKKMSALSCYHSQIDGNISRSERSAVSLSIFRGSQNGCDNAEAFKLIRLIT